jgi:DNA-binding transcriptional LysR family regulator
LALLAPAVDVLRRLPALKASHPAIHVEIAYETAAVLETELIAGTLSCAVVEEPWPSAFIDFKPWPAAKGVVPYVAVAAPGLVSPPLATSADVEQLPLIDAGARLPRLEPWLQTLPQPKGPTPPHAAWVVPTEGAMIALARGGGGVAMLPRALVEAELAAQTLAEVLPQHQAPARPRHLALRRANTRQLIELLVIEHLLEPDPESSRPA